MFLIQAFHPECLDVFDVVLQEHPLAQEALSFEPDDNVP
jgi:hypothetical protein